MRQWLVDPRYMCTRHVMGEHVEHHMFVGTMKKRTKVDGYLRNNLLEPILLESRHSALAMEMTSRGFNHKSPLDIPDDLFDYLTKDQVNHVIDRNSAAADLFSRCEECRTRRDGVVWGR